MNHGAVVWFTGLSGAGKSTLAGRIRELLIFAGYKVEILDGDDVRAFLSNDLGFSRKDRDTNVARIAYVARLLAKHGVIVLVAAISPYQAAREEARQRAVAAGLPFVDVYVEADLPVLVARDPKGLYQRAMAGELEHFTGVSDPYEPPAAPAIHVRTDRDPVTRCAMHIWEALQPHLYPRAFRHVR